MKIRVLALLLCAVAAIPVTASAVDVGGESRTYLRYSETMDNKKLLPLYEYLDFKIENTEGEDISFHFGGWGRYDITDEMSGKRLDYDLQYAYLKVRGGTANSVLQLGRVRVAEGVAHELIDGGYARTDLLGGFALAAFGGAPAETSTDGRNGDYIYGGRLSQGLSIYRIGASYLKEQNDGRDFREEAGGDLWFRPVAGLELAGRSSYNMITAGWMEHAYTLILGPFARIRLTGEGSWYSYDDYFASATNTAFRLTPGIIQPGEQVTILGGMADIEVLKNLWLTGDYRNFNYKIADSADYYGGKLAYSVPGSGGIGAAYHRMDGKQDRLCYTEYRGYALKKMGNVDAAADFIWLEYDRKINDVKSAYTAILAAGYNFGKVVKVAADVDYAHNPDYDKDVRAMLTIIYRFGKI